MPRPVSTATATATATATTTTTTTTTTIHHCRHPWLQRCERSHYCYCVRSACCRPEAAKLGAGLPRRLFE